MLTLTEALTANEFHAGECTMTIGPRGGRYTHTEVWRRNGKTKTWKTRPGQFRVPVKRGLWEYGSITETTPNVHTAETCPLRTVEVERPMQAHAA